jgi:hypothetical protein
MDCYRRTLTSPKRSTDDDRLADSGAAVLVLTCCIERHALQAYFAG